MGDGTTVAQNQIQYNPELDKTVYLWMLTQEQSNTGVDLQWVYGDVYDPTKSFYVMSVTYGELLEAGTLTLLIDFTAHVNTDLNRWQLVADIQAQVQDLQAGINNKIQDPDPAHTIDIEADANGDGYVVVNQLGGVIKFDLYSILLGFGQVTVTYPNGTTKVESAQGLSLIEVLHKQMDAPVGAVITCNTVGVDNIVFVPYIQG